MYISGLEEFDSKEEFINFINWMEGDGYKRALDGKLQKTLEYYYKVWKSSSSS